MVGFHGQMFDFAGNDGEWYALVSDLPSMHLNMRVTSPVPSVPEITYITGLSLLATDDDGFVHTVVISVKHPHSIESACPAEISPCLAEGALSVVLDGEEALVAPGTVTMAPGVHVGAANIPGECRSFGFEKYWEKKKEEAAMQGSRKLSVASMDMGEWILADVTATNMVECTEYVARSITEEGGVFALDSEHTSFMIVTPIATIRLSHGRLHQLPMRDPTDTFDLPDHLAWQMNLAIDHTDVSQAAQGILGETFVPTRDLDGHLIMHGMGCIRGKQEDCKLVHPCARTLKA